MGCFKLKTALPGLVSVFAATSLFANDQLVDDVKDGNNQNAFEQYWYYYDDNTAPKPDDRHQAAPDSKPSEIHVPSTEKDRNWGASDDHKIKDYTFQSGTEENGNKAAILPFTLGDMWPAPEPATWDLSPYVGMGTMLAPEGEKVDLSKITGFKFRIRSSKETFKVSFKVNQLGIEKDSTAGHYEYIIAEVTPEWEEYTVEVPAQLEQPSWAAADKRKRDLQLDSITKLAWHIESTEEGLSDTLWVDDIYVLGYTYISPFMWADTLSDLSKKGSADGKLADFDGNDPSFSKLVNKWFYGYNDKDINGDSKVIAGATEDDSGRLKLEYTDNTGAGGEGKGPQVKFSIGKTVLEDGKTDSVQGFIGIGVNLYDSSASEYFDASAKGFTHIYFQYMLAGDLTKASVEISDYWDVGDAKDPNRKDTRGSGIVYFRDVPATNGKWYAVHIPLDSLKVHDTWKGYTEKAFDKTKLAKFQIKVQGAKDAGGILGIDNIYFTNGSTPVLKTKSAFKTSPLAATYRNGKINVSWSGKTVFANGKISLVNAKGAVMQSKTINNANSLSETFAAKKLAAGVYFVNVNGADAQGKAVTMQTSLNVVK
ncbi:MAG TPA: hypothetical protein VHO70_04325 [Chitinispirillaceae bacterium]|nr:hypothetical protein [Chitinispirillaceae bacterium]